MIGYKLFRLRQDGTIGSLFINARARLPMGKWLKAGLHPTKGFAVRRGWHVLGKPRAPHLKMKPNRKWFKVEIKNFMPMDRPKSQGEIWYLASKMKIL